MKVISVFFLLFVFLFFSCRKKPTSENVVKIGTLEVDLDANESHIRTQEALIGNFICDAVKNQLEEKNIDCDFVMLNAGAKKKDHPEFILRALSLLK